MRFDYTDGLPSHGQAGAGMTDTPEGSTVMNCPVRARTQEIGWAAPLRGDELLGCFAFRPER